MSTRCKCCGRPVTGQRCGYCGLLSVTALDEPARVREQELADHYRNSLLSSITNFAVVTYRCDWNRSVGRFDLPQRETVPLGSALQCRGRILWSAAVFGPGVEPQKSRGVTLRYQVGGLSRTLTAMVPPVEELDSWRVGLLLHDDLSVTVYLGAEGRCTASSPCALSLLPD